jgi:hypothetical protein
MPSARFSWISWLLNRPFDPTGRVGKLAMIIDALMVPAIHSGEADRIEPLLGQLTDREISALSPTTSLGLTRLFLENG